MILSYLILVSIVVSIPACHAGDRGSIPRRGGKTFFSFYKIQRKDLSTEQVSRNKKTKCKHLHFARENHADVLLCEER